MQSFRYLLLIPLLALLFSCSSARKSRRTNVLTGSTVETIPATESKTPPENNNYSGPVRSLDVPLDIDRKAFVNYAKTFLGTPYKYGSSNPANGLDCSGLLYHIFQHYRVKSPRSSYDYANVGTTISLRKALPGDIILFSGENSRRIGHMGIVTENKDILKFIHAPGSGTRVTITPLSGYFEKHFVKVIRVLE